MKRFVLPALCLMLAFVVFVGGGFALFFFGNDYIENGDQTVTVKPEDALELGSVKLTDDGYDYKLFFDTDYIYLFRNDNLTADAQFAVICDLEKSKNLPDGYSVSLVCDITVSDSDNRGVKKEDFSFNGSIESCMYSDSIVDYFKPIAIALNSKEYLTFNTLSNDLTEKSVTYRCVISNDLQNITYGNSYTTEYFQIMFDYKDYNFTDGQHQYSGNMAPVNQYSSLDGYKKNMEMINAAKANSQITVVFKLMVQKENA